MGHGKVKSGARSQGRLGARALLSLVLAAGCTDLIGLQQYALVCEPGTLQPCYAGPDGAAGPKGTEGIGACRAGLQACLEDGSGFGACEGAVLPAPEDCGTADDEDCDAESPDEGDGCVCEPGKTAPCYTGDPEWADVGICESGLRVCDADGLGFGPCSGDVLPAAESCDVADAEEDQNCDGVKGCTGEPIWGKNFYARDLRITGDGDGGVVLVGSYGNTDENGDFPKDDFGGGPLAGKIFAARFDRDGEHVWSKAYLSISPTTPLVGVDTDSVGNIVFVVNGTFGPDKLGCLGEGPVQGHLTVVKLTPFGSCLWARSVGSSQDFGPATAADFRVGADDGVVLVGQHAPSDCCEGLDFGGGPLSADGANNMWIAKLSGADGAHVWSYEFPWDAAPDDEGIHVAVDSDNDVVVAASAEGTFEFLDTTISFLTKGTFLAKFSATNSFDAAVDWSDTVAPPLGKSGHLSVSSIVFDGDDNLLVGGSVDGTVAWKGTSGTAQTIVSSGEDAALVKVGGPAGLPIWTRVWGDSAEQRIHRVASDGAGNVVVVGSFRGTMSVEREALTSKGLADAFAVKLDPSANVVWARAAGAAGWDYALDVAVSPDGGDFVQGDFDAEIAWDDIQLTETGDKRYLVRLRP